MKCGSMAAALHSSTAPNENSRQETSKLQRTALPCSALFLRRRSRRDKVATGCPWRVMHGSAVLWSLDVCAPQAPWECGSHAPAFAPEAMLRGNMALIIRWMPTSHIPMCPRLQVGKTALGKHVRNRLGHRHTPSMARLGRSLNREKSQERAAMGKPRVSGVQNIPM